MRITILPKTALGWWSLSLIIALIASFVVVSTITGPEAPGAKLTTFDRASAVVLAGISGAAFLTGVVGIIRRTERSVLVFLTTLIGLFALIIAIGQAFGATIGW